MKKFLFCFLFTVGMMSFITTVINFAWIISGQNIPAGFEHLWDIKIQIFFQEHWWIPLIGCSFLGLYRSKQVKEVGDKIADAIF